MVNLAKFMAPNSSSPWLAAVRAPGDRFTSSGMVPGTRTARHPSPNSVETRATPSVARSPDHHRSSDSNGPLPGRVNSLRSRRGDEQAFAGLHPRTVILRDHVGLDHEHHPLL